MTDAMTRRAALLVVGAAVLACAKDDAKRSLSTDSAVSTAQLPPDHPSLDGRSTLSPAARTLLDSGNTAFRAKRFDDAKALYARAAQAAPDHAAPWFGIYMVAMETKQQGLADSAMKEVQRRTPAAAPGAPAAPGGSGTPAPFNPHAGTPRKASGP